MSDYALPDDMPEDLQNMIASNDDMALEGDDFGGDWPGNVGFKADDYMDNALDSIEESLSGLSEDVPDAGLELDIYHTTNSAIGLDITDLDGHYTPSIEIFGDPLHDMDLWDRQDEENSCAVATTNSLFRSLGFDPGEDLLSDIFQDYGIYHPDSGTTPSLIDDALNDLNQRMDLPFSAQEINNFTEDSLKEMLQQGSRPLIAIDAHNLYPFTPPGSGHAVQLTSIIAENGQSFAVINDPGFDEGAGIMFPLETFMEAAQPFSNMAIVLTAA
ncbi:hypothetical protein [Desulfosudis oleivorans]|uniref:Peptidase C39-like domain-containing protein n=1 Tax=Desulfosudis oleivorans (strain DSM 6200 / JCM 39069 / Hxd3) TaxID=96561 RepID=A8ZYL5_DESOH|nr:hypothetical protein [Desulfosudis oleivorans]ABW68740.1 hypothetical protein Dole_2937 [Desulfosudis oleivorans Hxd3]